MRRSIALFAAILALSSLVCGCTAVAISASNTPAAAAAAQDIENVLYAQAEAWNRGDIEAFMLGYWNSDRLRFDSADQSTFGWQATLDRYRAHYPDRAAMGQLTFSDLSVEVLAPDAAVVHGRWALKREHDAPHGVFTLLFRKFGQNWKITSDHTS